MNRPTKSASIIIASIVLMYAVNYFALPLWSQRTATVVILAFCGVTLNPPLALIPGIFAIPADMLGLGAIQQSFTAGGFLYWACLILVPYGLANILEKEPEDTSGDSSARESEVPAGEPRGTNAGQSTPSVSGTINPGDEEAFERLQWLIKHQLEQARDRYGFNLLLIYDVEQKTANLSYAVDPDDVVNREATFRADTGQGIGWVLRHNDELEQTRESIDWRNLQYRTKPADIDRVKIIPLYHDDRMSGILVVEWAVDPDDPDCSNFVEEVEHLMALRREIHQLQKSQDIVQLMEKLHELNPLEETRFDSMIHRSLEIVRSFVPAEEGNVEFFSYSDDVDSGDVIHQGRRAVYEECMTWIKESDEILRISDLRNHSLGQESLSRFGKVEVRSFLGGAVKKDDELVGMICLDHPDPDYFTRQDAELLGILLNHLSQSLRVGRRLEDMDEKQAEYRRLLNVFQLGETSQSLDSFVKRQVENLTEHLPLVSAGYYEREGGEARLVAYSGDGSPSERFERDHPMFRRIRNAESHSSMLTFPELDRFSGYEAPLSAEGLKVAPVGLDGRVVGFFALFVNDVDKFDDVLFEELERILPLLLAPIRLMIERERLEAENKKDSITDLVRFDQWKSELSALADDTDSDPDATNDLVVWYVRVPGFETIAEQRGREKARNWLKSTAKLLNELLEDSLITRSYAGTFLGVETGPAEKMEDRLNTVIERLSDWSFPTGQWPRPPKGSYARLSPPFPSVRKLIDAPFKQSRRAETTNSEE